MTDVVTPPTALWVVYDRPIDYPDSAIARKHLVPGGPTTSVIEESSVAAVQERLAPICRHWMPRLGGDDRHIVGVWL